MTITEPAQTPVRSTGPVQCAPWCRDGDGHPTATFREDQRCFTDQLRVELSLYPEIPEARIDVRTNEWLPAPDFVELSADRGPGEAVHVEIFRSGGGDAINMTFSELRQLVEHAQHLLGQVETA